MRLVMWFGGKRFVCVFFSFGMCVCALNIGAKSDSTVYGDKVK